MNIETYLPLVLFTYLFVINVTTYFVYVSDKHRAYYDKRRIPEALLLLLAIIGGAYGAMFAMLLFRHKTLHRSFMIAVPLSLVVWAAVLVLLKIKMII